MKKTSNKMSSYKLKMVALIACLALICTAAVATTVAYIITKTESKENIMTPSKVACEVEETFDGDVKTDVKIKNTGDTSAYIRAAIVVTWISDDENNKVSAITPVDGRTPDGFVLSVEIVASAVQSSPAQAVKDAWGVDVYNGTLVAPTALPANP